MNFQDSFFTPTFGRASFKIFFKPGFHFFLSFFQYKVIKEQKSKEREMFLLKHLFPSVSLEIRCAKKETHVETVLTINSGLWVMC